MKVSVRGGAFALAVMVNLLGHGEVSALPSQPAERNAAKLAQQAAARQVEGTRPGPRKSAEKRSKTGIAQTETALSAPNADASEKKEGKLSPFAFFSRDKAAPEAEAPAVPVGAAMITLAIAPWGEVFVDGSRIGVSPPVNEVEVAPGKRKIEIKNGAFPVYTQIVEIKADQKVRIKHKFN